MILHGLVGRIPDQSYLEKTMDIYQTTTEYLLKLPIFDSWHEMESILRRSAATRPRDWELPFIAYEALGEAREKAMPACAALGCAQISIILVDDMLDDDPRGEYHRIGNGRTANFAVAFQAAGAEALLESGASTKVRFEALNSHESNDVHHRARSGVGYPKSSR